MPGVLPRHRARSCSPHPLQNAELAACGLTTADGGPIKLGSQITLNLGTRTVTNKEDGASFTATAIRGDYYDEATQTEAYAADLGQIEGTVVGFYRCLGLFQHVRHAGQLRLRL